MKIPEPQAILGHEQFTKKSAQTIIPAMKAQIFIEVRICILAGSSNVLIL